MTDAKDRDDKRNELRAEALGSANSARHVAHVTGMSADAAKTYAAFLSGRWALGPAAGRRAR